MKRYPNICNVNQVIADAKTVSCELPDGRWVPARPIGWQSWAIRWKAAWLVFRGHADALIWDGQ
jgi:hypothetical protein